jgi:hypothetical protein
MPFTKQNPREMKLLAEEDGNSRKCQKESKKWMNTKARSIVATMTPIVPRWENLVTKEKRAYLFYFGNISTPSWYDGSEAH